MAIQMIRKTLAIALISQVMFHLARARTRLPLAATVRRLEPSLPLAAADQDTVSLRLKTPLEEPPAAET